MGLQKQKNRSIVALGVMLFLCIAFVFTGVACQKACRKAPIAPVSYDPTIPLEQKIQGVLPWTPRDADLVAVFDTNKLLTSVLYKALPAGIRNSFPWEYIRSGSDALSARLGLVASFIKFGKKDDPFRHRAILLQGGMNKEEILKGIEVSMRDAGKGIEMENSAGVNIYTYADGDEALNSIAFLEPNLVAIGTKEGIAWVAGEHKKNSSEPPQKSIFEGFDLTKTAGARIMMTENLKTFFPPLFHPIKTIDVSAGVDDGLGLKAAFSFVEAKPAAEFAKNLEGLKAIEEITSLDNKWLRSALGAIRITADGDRVFGELSMSAKVLLKILEDEDK